MKTIEEIMARMSAIMDGAANRDLTDEEVTEYEGLEGDLKTAQRTQNLRSRHSAYNAVRQPGPAPVATITREAQPYRVKAFQNRITGEVDFRFSNDNQHNFADDLGAMMRAADGTGERTEAGKRVMAVLRQVRNADVQTDDINELNPTVDRPDLFVDKRDFRTPLLDLIGKGTPPNGVQPFRYAKWSSESGLVADHTEGTEPTGGAVVTTSATVTPTAVSGKVSVAREVLDMGGNSPTTAGLILTRMNRAYYKSLESAAATFLGTLTAATDIALTTAAVDTALTNGLEAALAGLQFVEDYDFSAMVLEQVLYKALAAAEDDSGRKVYPILNPQNANGTALSRFRLLNIAGYIGIPSWALASTPGASNSSWLFDPTVIAGWWTAPQELRFPGTDQSDGSYAPVAYVDLAMWGYKAFANFDIGGVRQITYDSVS